MFQRLPYAGTERKLVLALDIGTTFSGVSYCILDPGQVPEIKTVTRFPGQEQVGGNSKIPTVIYYDNQGKVRAIGAEVVGKDFENVEQGWTKAEWFKLHLRPKRDLESTLNEMIPPLPKGKKAIDLFADFMEYLYESARTFVQELHGTGELLWRSLESNIQFIFTHPNGWGGAQQAELRKAAIRAGLVTDAKAGSRRIHFVTEGEASLHFCIHNGLATSAGKGEDVLIVDAGGGTVDLSAYSESSGPAKPALSFQESAPSQCHFQGSVFVTRRARSFLDDLLRGSKFHDDVDDIANSFDKTTKLRFRNRDEPQYIKFGRARDTDAKLDIRHGQLKVSGTDVASFFEPSISCIVEAILEMHKVTGKAKVSSVFLVGGFAASDWLFSQVKKILAPLRINLYRPDSHVNKAVAMGGVSYYVDHYVTARVAKYTYGIEVGPHYNPADMEHQQRFSKTFYDAALGAMRIHGMFDTILSKETLVTETKEFRKRYKRSYLTPGCFPDKIKETILCYKGSSRFPRWIDSDPHNFPLFCTIVTDGAPLKNILTRSYAERTQLGFCYSLHFDIVLSLGLTELTAEISYVEDGKEKRFPAEITYAEE